MKKMRWLFMSFLWLFLIYSCKEKQGKKAQYTVYQAGQTGGRMAMSEKDSMKGKRNLMLSKRERILANVKTDTVQRKVFSKKKILTGKTILDPRKKYTISAWSSGQIKKMYVNNPGKYIKKGETLYEIYSPELLAIEKDYLTTLQQRNSSPSSKEDQIDLVLKNIRKKLLRFGLSEQAIDGLSKRKGTSATMPIHSKVNGYLDKKIKEEGDFVEKGDAVFQLISNQTLWVQTQLYDTDLPLLSEDIKVWIETDAFPGKKWIGHVVYDNPVIVSNSRVCLLNISINNLNGKLFPEMPVYVYLQIDYADNVLMIPKSAVIYGEKQDYVWMEMPSSDSTLSKKKFVRRAVELGKENETDVEIIKGLRAGEVIVSSGTYLLNSAYLLKHGESSMEGMDM